MKEEQKKLIFEYVYGRAFWRERLDGNVMVAAMKKMKEKKEFRTFLFNSGLVYLNENKLAEIDLTDFIPYLMQPERFFALMAQWREGKENSRMKPSPDERNESVKELIVRVYFTFNAEHDFPARDIFNAREIAKRVITEGAWIVEENSETFYPVNQIYKVKIIGALGENT